MCTLLKRISYFISILTFLGCATHYYKSKNGYFHRTIKFTKEEVGFKVRYSIFMPDLKSKNFVTSRTITRHSHEFSIIYPDKSTIYYSDNPEGWSLNFKNYPTIGWIGYSSNEYKRDTIIFGIQANGQYWKEIIKNGKYLGYCNISKLNKETFDSSLSTFKKL